MMNCDRMIWHLKKLLLIDDFRLSLLAIPFLIRLPFVYFFKYCFISKYVNKFGLTIIYLFSLINSSIWFCFFCNRDSRSECLLLCSNFVSEISESLFFSLITNIKLHSWSILFLNFNFLIFISLIFFQKDKSSFELSRIKNVIL